MKKLFSSKQAADFLGVSMSRIYKLTHQRELTHIKFFGKLRFDPEELEKFVEEHSIVIKSEDELMKKAEKLAKSEGTHAKKSKI